jgi:hypothetical protein
MAGKSAVAGFGKFSFNEGDTEQATVATAATQHPPAPVKPKAERPPSRRGKKNVNFVLSEQAWEQLSILSVRTRRPIQDLMVEATDMLFQANNLSRIARG